MSAVTDWIDAVDDLDIDLLGMSDDEMDAFAYEHAGPMVAVSRMKPRAQAVERPHTPLPHAA